MGQELSYNGTRAQFRRLMQTLVDGLAGRSTEYAAYVHGIKLRVGMVALSCIEEAFWAKADGGMGEDGIVWPALKKETIAARPVGPSDRTSLKAMGIKKGKHGYSARPQGAGDLDKAGRLKRGFLTEAQDKRWRMIFATRKANMMAAHGMGEEAAAGRAAAIAWATLKAEGAKTKLDVLGNRNVQIGRSSGRLLASLSPAVPDATSVPITFQPEAVEDQILRDEPGAEVVGSSVEYAGPFHALRRLWPEGDLPAAWAERIEDATQSGLVEAVQAILAGQGTVAA